MISPTVHHAALSPEQLLKHCDVRRTRRSGPGGQHRNKVETAVVLTHRPTGVTSEGSERRSQLQNQAVAIFRLRVNLALAVRRLLDAGTPPSALWQSRCQQGKIAVNPEHDDFPALLAEALDFVAARHMDIRAAAEQLGATPTQLTRFLRQEPRALALVNRARAVHGRHKLK